MMAGWPRAWTGCWSSAAEPCVSRRVHKPTPLPARTVAVHGRQPPGEFERIAAGKAADDAADQAAEQKRLPGGAQAVLEPVPVRMKLEMPRAVAQQQGADAICEVVDRHHRERIDDIAAGDSDRDVER